MKENSQERPSSKESAEYFELLKFRTVGADPANLRECAACATWLKKWLEGIGAEAELILPRDNGLAPTPPVVFAERKGDDGAPVVLFYGHYDVQPPDPLDAWVSPPFEPEERDGRIYCRGAQDDKGQFFSFLCGVRDFLSDGKHPVPTIKFFIEGQEESGSIAAEKIAPEIKSRLAANILAVCDTGAAPGLQPAIVAGLRGVVHFTATLKGAKCDLHSGRYGGVSPNAAQCMAELVASLHGENGEIAVRGFSDGIIPPSAKELAAAEASSPDAAAYEAETGVPPCGGEKGKSPAERNSFLPTIEINGIHSGYGGPGSKTVIPCSAVAKLSMRLVPGQNPARCMELVERHMKRHLAEGMELTIETAGLSKAMRLPLESPAFRMAAEALGKLDPRGAVFQYDGASIPIISTLADVSGAAPLLVGFGQGEDNIHSPNESFSWRQFALCRKWAKLMLESLVA